MKKKLLLLFISFLVLGNGVLFSLFYQQHANNQKLQTELLSLRQDQKTAEFLKMFVYDILQAKTVVDFDTRLKLENAVRDIEDKEIFNSWQAFINSSTEIEAQVNAQKLLQSLADKLLINQE